MDLNCILFKKKQPEVLEFTHNVSIRFKYVGQVGAKSDEEAANLAAEYLSGGDQITLFRIEDKTLSQWYVGGNHTAFFIE